MLKFIEFGGARPVTFIVDPSDEFEGGMLAQLKTNGNQIVCGVSDGTAPIGVIDDMKKQSFSANSIDEVVIAPIPEVLVTEVNGNRVISIDVKMELENSNVIESSFISKYIDVQLIANNGIVVFLEGTELNFDLDGDGIPDSIRTVVSYRYRIADVPGDDTTFSSGRITVWVTRMLISTDMFETNQTYPLNAPLYCSEGGLFTTRKIADDYPAIGIVTAPPNSLNGFLELLFI